MMTNLDYLVIMFMGMSAVSLLAVCLMFLIKKGAIKKGCFYFLALEGMAMSVLNALMTPGSFPGELAIGWGLGALSIAALLLEVCGKGEKKFMIARIMVAVAVIAGMFNAFVY